MAIADTTDELLIVNKKLSLGKKNGYVMMWKDRKMQYFYRVLMNPNGQYHFVDHMNGNTLDNRCENLQMCTPAQNQMNRFPQGGAEYKGVRTEKREILS
jgi:hypothetical protein